jgi:tetratricopeptide (TPR) repeat protein
MFDKFTKAVLDSLNKAEDETNRLGLLYSASAAFHRNEFKQALELYERYVAKCPATDVVLINAIHCCLQLDLLDRALQLCNKAVVLHPKDSGPYAERAFVYVQLLNADAAIKDANYSLSLNDKNSCRAYYARSCAKEMKYQYQDALADSEKAISIHPDAFGFMQRASIKLALKQFDEARSDCALAFSKLEAGTPSVTYSKFLQIRAAIIGATNEIESAIQDCTRALEVNPRNCGAYIDRAYYHSRLKNLKAAGNDLEAAASLAPSKQTLACLYSHKARLELLSGNVLKALELTTKAIDILPERASLLATHGLALMRNSRFEAAEIALSMAIDLDRCETEAYWFRGELHQLTGQTGKAEADKAIAREWDYVPYI